MNSPKESPKEESLREEFKYDNGTTYFGPLEGGYPKDGDNDGELDFGNNIIYKGSFEAYYPGGKGKMNFPNDKEITGDFVNGVPTHGKIIFVDKREYEGAISDYKMHGEGKLIDKDGKVLEDGIFENGNIKDGKVYNKGEKDKYTGAYKNGKRDGEGTLVLENGDSYDGEFKNGIFISGLVNKKNDFVGYLKYNEDDKTYVREGRGFEKTEGETYNGKFKKNKRHGQGKLTYKDGLEYEGKFKNGLPHGEGKLIDKDGKVLEDGTFEKGNIKDGQVYNRGEKDKYTGAYKNGKKDGQGTLVLEKGDRYDGNFKNGYFDGQGTFTFKDGTVYDGKFENGRFQGEGKLVYNYENAPTHEGNFIDGSTYETRSEKKDQKVLLINKDESLLNLGALRERYNSVEHFNESSTMNAEYLKNIITQPTKGDKDNKKLKIVISTHGTFEGGMIDQPFVIESLKDILSEIKSYNSNIKSDNQSNQKDLIKNFDIVLNACYASNVVTKNEEFQEVLKDFVKADMGVRVSAGDGEVAASTLITNSKNLLPIFKTEKGEKGVYTINEYNLKTLDDFKDIKPSKIKDYKTIDDFLKDKYIDKKVEVKGKATTKKTKEKTKKKSDKKKKKSDEKTTVNLSSMAGFLTPRNINQMRETPIRPLEETNKKVNTQRKSLKSGL